MNADILQNAKSTVRDFHAVFDTSADTELTDCLAAHVGSDYLWRGMHPFCEQHGASAVADVFWLPLRKSITSLQRREDVFMAGFSDVDQGQSVWVAFMGNMMGLFDHDWLGIPATRKIEYKDSQDG